MAVIKVNGRVIEVPKVLLAYASPSFFLREFYREQIGELGTQRSGLEERLHDLRISDEGVVGFHENEDGLGRFDVDVLFPGIHVYDDNDHFSFAYLMKGKPVLRKEDGSDFVVDVDPYYNVDERGFQLYTHEDDKFRERFGPFDIRDKVKIYDRDGRFIGLVDRDKLSFVSGADGKDILDVKNCKVTPWSNYFEGLFEHGNGFGLTGRVDVNQSEGIPVVSGAIYKPGEILLKLDYATKVLGLNFRERVLAERLGEKTIITAPHSDIKRGEARGGEINANTGRVPEVGVEPKVVVDPEFKDKVEGAYDIHGVPRPRPAAEVDAEVVPAGAEDLSGLEIDLDAEPLEFADGEIPVEGDATMRDLQEVGRAAEQPSLERRVEDEVRGLLDRHSYFDALSRVQQDNVGISVYDVVKTGVDYFVRIESYEDAISLAEKSSNPDLSKYTFMSICDKTMADKKYSVAIVHAKMVSPEYFDAIKKDVLERLSWEEDYDGAASILMLLGDNQGALTYLEGGRLYDRAIRLAEGLGDSDRVNILRKRARPLGELRLSIEQRLMEYGQTWQIFIDKFNSGFSALYKKSREATKNTGRSFRNYVGSGIDGMVDEFKIAGGVIKTKFDFGSTDWNKIGRRSLLLALGLAVGYGAYDFVKLPSQTRDEKEAWSSARELKQNGDLNGALIYARRAQNAMRWYEKLFYGVPGIDSDYEDFANNVIAERERALAKREMLVDYPVSTDDREWLHGLLAQNFESKTAQLDVPKQATQKIRPASGLEGVTKKLGAYFGLSFREGDPYTSNFENEVRNQYENYVSQHGGISSGSFRFVYVVNNGTISKAVLVRDGDGDALNFGKSLLGSIRGKKVQSPDGVYASNLYRFGGK